MKIIITQSKHACLVGLDFWEGVVDFEPAEWVLAGISFVLMRLNHIAGALHKDGQFDLFWRKCAGLLLRGIYFVVDPGLTAQQMFDWIKKNWPADAPKVIFLDVEVRQAGRDPQDYASMLQGLIGLLKKDGFVVHIYTGQGYEEMLDPWPAAPLYWWSAYPFSIEPSSAAYAVTWEQLWTKLSALSWPPYNQGHCAGKIAMWQVADVLIVPGCPGHAMDVNLFYGGLDDLRSLLGYPFEGSAPMSEVSKTGAYKATSLYAWVRPAGPGENFAAAGKLVKDEAVIVTKLSPDEKWGWVTPTGSAKWTPGWVNMLGLVKTTDPAGTVVPPVVVEPPKPQGWQDAIDAWARGLGYTGPRPS